MHVRSRCVWLQSGPARVDFEDIIGYVLQLLQCQELQEIRCLIGVRMDYDYTLEELEKDAGSRQLLLL